MVARRKLPHRTAARVLAMCGLLLATVGLAINAAPEGPGPQAASRFTTVPAKSVVGPAGQSLTAASRNVNVTNKNGAQSETSVAVDPTNPLHMLADANDLSVASGATVIIY